MKTIKLTEEQYQALQNGESITLEPPKKKWEPQHGNYTISGGDVFKASSIIYAKFGASRKTKQQAEKTSDKMRAFNRLLAYVDEFAPDYDPDWSKETNKYYVYVTNKGEYIYVSDIHCKDIGKVYMPEDVARTLVEKLNSGEVVL